MAIKELCQMPQNHRGESPLPEATETIVIGDLFDPMDLSGLPAPGSQISVCVRCAEIYRRDNSVNTKDNSAS